MRHRTIGEWKYAARWLFFFSLLWHRTEAQIRYMIPEELKEGSFVGSIAKDLALEISDIADRKLRIASESYEQYFSVDTERGDLVVNSRIDRETLCGQSASCLLTLQIVVENPLQMHKVDVEIQDINDNSPKFPTKEGILKISELTALGTRFTLESAVDLDVGSNSLKSYSLSNNNLFRLNSKNLKGRHVPELVLEKNLDREKQATHTLILTALDGGNPVKTGTSVLQIIVQDVNDNTPKFEVTVYRTSILESAGFDSKVIKLKATDLDEGPNGEIQYLFCANSPDSVTKAFSINSETGDIIVIGKLDYETTKSYTFDVCAKDKGNPELEGQSSVEIDVIDENDNPPAIILTSLPSPVSENATVGTVVALITVNDLDSGNNGKVQLSVSSGLPFKLERSFDNHYSLITDSFLDRENISEYNMEILAMDSGVTSLKTVKSLKVKILDVNDNPPVFSHSSYNVYLNENNQAGTSVFSVSASDKDQNNNARIFYSILDLGLNRLPASSYFYINSDNGTIYTL